MRISVSPHSIVDAGDASSVAATSATSISAKATYGADSARATGASSPRTSWLPSTNWLPSVKQAKGLGVGALLAFAPGGAQAAAADRAAGFGFRAIPSSAGGRRLSAASAVAPTGCPGGGALPDGYHALGALGVSPDVYEGYRVARNALVGRSDVLSDIVARVENWDCPEVTLGKSNQSYVDVQTKQAGWNPDRSEAHATDLPGNVTSIRHLSPSAVLGRLLNSVYSYVAAPKGAEFLQNVPVERYVSELEQSSQTTMNEEAANLHEPIVTSGFHVPYDQPVSGVTTHVAEQIVPGQLESKAALLAADPSSAGGGAGVTAALKASRGQNVANLLVGSPSAQTGEEIYHDAEDKLSAFAAAIRNGSSVNASAAAHAANATTAVHYADALSAEGR